MSVPGGSADSDRQFCCSWIGIACRQETGQGKEGIGKTTSQTDFLAPRYRERHCPNSIITHDSAQPTGAVVIGFNFALTWRCCRWPASDIAYTRQGALLPLSDAKTDGSPESRLPRTLSFQMKPHSPSTGALAPPMQLFPLCETRDQRPPQNSVQRGVGGVFLAATLFGWGRYGKASATGNLGEFLGSTL